MKAGILLTVVVALGAVFWATGNFKPPARHLLITDVSATPLGRRALAVTMTIENQGDPDQLLDVASPAAETRFQNATRGLPIPGGRSSLALDAAHVVAVPSGAALEDGALLPLTLRFDAAGEVSVKARVIIPEPNSMAAHMAMGHGAMTHEVKTGPAPALSLAVSQSDTGWFAKIETEHFAFSEDLQNGDHVPGTGHGHIYVGDMKLGRVFSDSFAIGALPKGTHSVRVTLNTNDHRAIVVDGKPVAAEAIIEVD